MLARASNSARRAATNARLMSSFSDSDVVIASAARTPVGSFNGSLASLSATELGSKVVKAALERAGINSDAVNEVIMGNVVSAGLGQAPARQAALYGGLPRSVPCTTVNKVCASGMKSIMMSAQSILAGQNDVVVAGGFESMSNVPYYLPGGRNGMRFGHGKVLDGLLHDGLWDVYNNHPMGNCGDICATKYSIGREEQDSWTIRSYERAAAAIKNGLFDDEIVPVEVPQRRGDPVVFAADEEPARTKVDKIPSLRPAFAKDGTVTAANASPLNDGATGLVVTSGAYARANGIKPLARVAGFGDAATDPVDFTIAPSMAIPIALQRAGLEVKDIDYHEINEAFAVVALVNARLLGLDHDRINVNGGAVALGHPIGNSGARIVTTLINVLKQNSGRYGCASICNGGGGASAIVIENLD